MSQIARIDQPELPAASTPMAIIERAVASGASIDTISKLMDLQERWEANQARKAFNEAVSEAKAKIRPVVRNKTGHNSRAYADFAAIASAVDPILADLGLSYRFRTEQGERINVTCILSHRDGHQETTTLSGPPDASGNKNAIQAIGSTLTYLQRYSLVQMLGLAAADDDDGRAGGVGATLNDEQIERIQKLVLESGANVAAFLNYMKAESISDIHASKFKEAVAMLEQKKRAKQS